MYGLSEDLRFTHGIAEDSIDSLAVALNNTTCLAIK